MASPTTTAAMVVAVMAATTMLAIPQCYAYRTMNGLVKRNAKKAVRAERLCVRSIDRATTHAERRVNMSVHE